MGGHQVESHGSGDDGFDEEGYDESQRAEILEATRSGPSDGTVIVDLDPDMGMEDDAEEEDDLSMDDDEVGEEVRADHSPDDDGEDDVQDEFDDGSDGEDELDDRDDEALKP